MTFILLTMVLLAIDSAIENYTRVSLVRHSKDIEERSSKE